ncbi:MAG: CvpA family protein [Bacteroidetes bacterium]|nr:CvpA family protein [Bacteroidota bacterium]MBU1718552.1 CvpA family protein [Bacteroidota bacterium]
MHFIDIILVIPLLWGIYKGIMKGLIIEVTTLVALLGGVYAGIHFSSYLGDVLSEYMNPQYVELASFAIIFLGVVVGVFWVGKAIEKTAEKLSLGVINKIGGAAFGVLKYGLIVSVLLSFINRMDVSQQFVTPEIRQQSLLYKPLSQLGEYIYPKLGVDEQKIKAVGEEFVEDQAEKEVKRRAGLDDED